MKNFNIKDYEPHLKDRFEILIHKETRQIFATHQCFSGIFGYGVDRADKLVKSHNYWCKYDELIPKIHAHRQKIWWQLPQRPTQYIIPDNVFFQWGCKFEIGGEGFREAVKCAGGIRAFFYKALKLTPTEKDLESDHTRPDYYQPNDYKVLTYARNDSNPPSHEFIRRTNNYTTFIGGRYGVLIRKLYKEYIEELIRLQEEKEKAS